MNVDTISNLGDMANPVAEEELGSGPESRLNEIMVDPTGFMLIRFSLMMDVLSSEVVLSDDVQPGEKYWGLIINSKVTKDPIIVMAVGHEQDIKNGLEMLRQNPASILQCNDTTLVVKPDDGNTGGIVVLQSLTITNTFFSENIASIEYNPLDSDQLVDLIKLNNSVVKSRYAADEAMENEEEDAPYPFGPETSLVTAEDIEKLTQQQAKDFKESSDENAA